MLNALKSDRTKKPPFGGFFVSGYNLESALPAVIYHRVHEVTPDRHRLPLLIDVTVSVIVTRADIMPGVVLKPVPDLLTEPSLTGQRLECAAHITVRYHRHNVAIAGALQEGVQGAVSDRLCRIHR